jgi:RNA polymerase sigma factor (TIGR02999 family)
MPSTNTVPEITMLLQRARAGDREAEERLINSIHPQLKVIAKRFMRSEREGHTLQTTALVNEAYLKIFGGAPVDWRDRKHFMAIAANHMRRVLVDHGREVGAAKRGKGAKVQLDESHDLAGDGGREVESILIKQLIGRLEKEDPPAARVVELKFLDGLTDGEVAARLETSEKTVRRHWEFARNWLRLKVAKKVDR